MVEKKMVNLMINDHNACVPEGTTIMEAARTVGIEIPHLCYLKEINEIGACRVCCVEVEGERAMVPACNSTVREGMVVKTNSPKARNTRRVNVELILSEHDCRCAACVRSGNCQLQKVANDLGIMEVPYENAVPKGRQVLWTKAYPLYRDHAKCIKCMRCIQICDKVQSVGIWDLSGSGGRTRIDVSYNRMIKESDCTLCGQCITHCPVGALHERDDVVKFMHALADKDKIVVAQIAPAVRAGLADAFGLTPEEVTVNRIAALLKHMGVDYVFDTSFTADLTIMEEGNELLKRMKKGDLVRYPMFTSCCPGWVRFLKSQYPELTGRLSSAKSPQQMFGSVIKQYFAEKIEVDPKKIVSVSIMPCVAKKAESELPTMETEKGRDVDIVLTTRELARMIRIDKLNPGTIKEVPFDDPLADYTGAGVIFGATGGVMEAALRSAYFLTQGKNPDPDAFSAIREGQGWRDYTFTMGDITLRCAVASGLGNARKLIEAILAGKARYEFVEIMACPGGCVGGGGQPISMEDEERAEVRGCTLYKLDKENPVRFSHENPQVQFLYQDWLGKPLSELSEKYLHTDHFGWEMPESPRE